MIPKLNVEIIKKTSKSYFEIKNDNNSCNVTVDKQNNWSDSPLCLVLQLPYPRKGCNSFKYQDDPKTDYQIWPGKMTERGAGNDNLTKNVQGL